MSTKNLGDRIVNTKEQIDNKIKVINIYMEGGRHFIDSRSLQSDLQDFLKTDCDAYLARCENSKRIMDEISSAATLERKRRTLRVQFDVKKHTVDLKRKFKDESDATFYETVMKQQQCVGAEFIPSSSSKAITQSENTDEET